MSTYYWSDDFASGNETIDSQHKYLFKLINDFASQNPEQVSDDNILLFLDKLYEYCNFHFKEEEKLMSINKYPLLEYHSKIHKELTKTVINTREQLQRKEICVQYKMIVNFCLQWLNNHIAAEDLLFVNFSRNKHYSLEKNFINRKCEIVSTDNQFLGIGRIRSIEGNYVIIENSSRFRVPVKFNDLIKVLSVSPETNKTQTFVAFVFYATAEKIKLFSPTIIQTKNNRKYFRVQLSNTDATITFNECEFPAQIDNISEGGLKIHTQKELTFDNIIKVQFVLQNTVFKGFYKVVRVEKKQHDAFNYGLELTDMDKELYKKVAIFAFNKQCMLRKELNQKK